MELSDLLAQVGVGTDDLDSLLKWARKRSETLLAGIDPSSSLVQVLDHTGVPQQPQLKARSSPRAISRPYLGAAVQAALSGKQDELDIALEAAEQDDDEPPIPEQAVEEDTPMLAEDDPSIGGFNRLAFSVRGRVASTPTQSASSSSSSLSNDFEAQAAAQLPEPPGFAPDSSSSSLRRRPILDAEASGGLVLGIPDDEDSFSLRLPIDDVLADQPEAQSAPQPQPQPEIQAAPAPDPLPEAVVVAPVSRSQPNRRGPPPPPPNGARKTKDSGPQTTAVPIQAAPAPASGPSKKAKASRKKVVDLGMPVSKAAADRPTSRPSPVAEPIPASPPARGSIPDYLRDDDE